MADIRIAVRLNPIQKSAHPSLLFVNVRPSSFVLRFRRSIARSNSASAVAGRFRSSQPRFPRSETIEQQIVHSELFGGSS